MKFGTKLVIYKEKASKIKDIQQMEGKCGYKNKDKMEKKMKDIRERRKGRDGKGEEE